MTKTLQKRFVFSSMLAITILLAILLGVINIANTVLVQQQTKKNLQMISGYDGEIGNLDYDREGTGEQLPEKPDGEPPEMPSDSSMVPPEKPEGEPPEMPRGRDAAADYDTFMSSNFFVVRLDSSKAVTYVDVSHVGSVSEEEAGTLAIEVLEKGGSEGRTANYRYRVTDSRVNGETTVVFLDVSGQNASCLRVLLISAGIGILCWFLMLLIVWRISGRAVRPIAENIEKQKQFITNAGHDLKTPLAIIKANAEAMELYNGENKWSRNIKTQTDRLSELMNRLLLLSRMDENSEKPEKTEFSLSGLAEQFAEDFAEAFENRKITVEKEISPEVTVLADKGQTEQLLSILLDNAVKYTEEGGQVRISLRKDAGRAVLELENTCTEIPQVPPERLFDRFYRSDSARTQKNGGFGIGLAVARAICEANEGSITASYLTPPGVKFTVIL